MLHSRDHHGKAMECGQSYQLINLEDEDHYAFVEQLGRFAMWYSQVHKVLSAMICIFGMLANVVHILVLTRPVMKRSTVNRVLAYMAVCDIFIMLSYLVYTIRFGFLVNADDPPMGYPYHWILFLFVHVILSIALHSITLYLSVVTAYIRFKAINQVNSYLMQPEIAWKLLVCVSSFVAVFCIPTFLVHDILPAVDLNSEQNPQPIIEGLFTVGLPRNEKDYSCTLFMANLWLTGLFFKVVPCVLMLSFTIALILKLKQNKEAHEKIVSKCTAHHRNSVSDRTTIMLILLLTVFILTELPQGVLAFLNAIFPDDVHKYIYMSVGEVLDLLSLINGNVCFILYPLLSSQYRETFMTMFLHVKQRVWDEQTSLRSKFYRSENYMSIDTEGSPIERLTIDEKLNILEASADPLPLP